MTRCQRLPRCSPQHENTRSLVAATAYGLAIVPAQAAAVVRAGADASEDFDDEEDVESSSDDEDDESSCAAAV